MWIDNIILSFEVVLTLSESFDYFSMYCRERGTHAQYV